MTARFAGLALSALSAIVLSGSMLAATAKADTTATTVLTIKGMTCGGCVAAVKLQLRKTEGVTAYEVSYEKAEAQVTYEPAKTTPEKIAASVSKTGFTASVKPSQDHKGAASNGGCEGGSCQRDCCKDTAHGTSSLARPMR